MDDQENIDEDQQMMCIPEGIKSSQMVEWPWKLDNIPPKRVSCQCEGETHHNNHENPSCACNTFQQVAISWLLEVELRSKNSPELPGWT